MSTPSTTDDKENLGHLVAQTARAWRYALDARLQPLGLSRAQWTVLLHASRAKTPLTQKELAHLSGVEGPTMAGLLDRMERAGWVERRVGKTDRRSKTVHLTTTAKRLSRRVEGIASELRAELLDEFSHEEIACCMNLLTRIYTRARLRNCEEPKGNTGAKSEDKE